MYKNIKVEMVKNGLTNRDLANILGLRESLIVEKINGSKDFKISEIIKLIALFGNISSDYLLKD